MASVDNALQSYKSLLLTVGKSVLNSLYPDDFELYLCAFELVDGSGKVQYYFVFPIQPYSNTEANKPIQNIKKTAGGITVLSTQTFSPTDIIIQGNFGRNFKFLTGNTMVNFSSLLRGDAITQEWNASIKTGYGCTKVLEMILKKSKTLDDNGLPYALYFYNLSLGNNYVVKATSFDFTMSQEMNMIWNYRITLHTLLPLADISGYDEKSALNTLRANAIIQGSVNEIGNMIGQMLSNTSSLIVNSTVRNVFAG